MYPGADAEFVKESIACGVLRSAEASKIHADVNANKESGMFLRITQNGEVCTVGASVAKKMSAPFAHGNQDTISTRPSDLTVSCSMYGR